LNENVAQRRKERRETLRTLRLCVKIFLLSNNMNAQVENKITAVLNLILSELTQDSYILSERFHSIFPYKKKDNTIFFPLLIAYTISQIKKSLPEKVHTDCDKIISLCLEKLPEFKNTKGRNTYNFWRKKEGAHFPYGSFFHRFEKFAIADDADITAFTYLLTKDYDYSQSKQLLKKHFSPKNDKPCYPKMFNDLEIYTTWYGENMRRQTDAAVLCNVLLWVLNSENELSLIDKNSIEYLERIISGKSYFYSTEKIAHTYFIPEIIYYHLARTVCLHEKQFSPQTKILLAEQGENLFKEANSAWKKLIVSSSLLRLRKSDTEEISFEKYLHDYKNFEWFSASFLSYYNNTFLQIFKPFFEIKFRNKAYYYTLYLENLVLRNQIG
jgi:hypothetical protein